MRALKVAGVVAILVVVGLGLRLLGSGLGQVNTLWVLIGSLALLVLIAVGLLIYVLVSRSR